MVSIGRFKSTNLFAKSSHRLNGPFRSAPAIPATASCDFADFRLRVGIGTVSPTEEKPLALMAQSDAGPASLQRLISSCQAPGFWGHGRSGARPYRIPQPLHAAAGLVPPRGTKNNPCAKRKAYPCRRRWQGCAGVGLRGRKTPGTHCACAKRTRQSTRRARRRGQGRV